MSADVIRLRPERLGPTLPPITEHWPRAKAVPLERRPWQLLLVPPTPGAPTRGFNIARWQARLVLGFAAVLLLVAGAGVFALVIAVRSPDLFATSAEAALLRARLTVVEDSLALARSELEAPDDTLASALLGGAIPTSSAAAPAARRTKLATPGLKPLARRTTRSGSDDDSELIDRRHRRAAGDRRDREPILPRAPTSAAAHHSAASRRRRRGAARNADHGTRSGCRELRRPQVRVRARRRDRSRQRRHDALRALRQGNGERGRTRDARRAHRHGRYERAVDGAAPALRGDRPRPSGGSPPLPTAAAGAGQRRRPCRSCPVVRRPCPAGSGTRPGSAELRRRPTPHRAPEAGGAAYRRPGCGTPPALLGGPRSRSG